MSLRQPTDDSMFVTGSCSLDEKYIPGLLDNIACGLVVIGQDLRVSYMNRWIREQVEERRSESSPFCYTLFRNPPGSQPCPDCPALKTFGDGEVHAAEVNPDVDKPKNWYLLSTSPINGTDGTVLAVAELVVDVSARKRVEQELKSSKELLSELAEYRRRILEQACVGVATVDLDGRILSWNQGAERMFGYSAAEAIGKNVGKLLAPEDGYTWHAPAKGIRELGLWEGAVPLKSKENKRVWARCHVSLMRNDSGQPVAAIAVLTDVSAEQKAREEFIAWENRLKTIVEHAPFDIGAVDADGVVTVWGGATEANTGIPKSVAVGSKLADLLPDDAHCRRFLSEIEGVLRSRKMAQFEEHARRSMGPKRGQESEEVTWLIPILADDGKAHGCVWYMWDATEFRRLQQELLRAERMAALGTLAGGVAHECNNIMGSIQLYAQLALKKADLDSSSQALNVVLAGVDRVKRIVQSLLEFSGDRPMRRRWVNLADVMENALVLFERELEQKGISVVRDYGGVPDVFADAHRLGQVFINLITNARDSMVPDGGVLRVRTGCRGDCVTISLSDTGRGIPEELVDRIFDPFFTTKGPFSASSTPGTGLGLSASYGIIQDHGGTIAVESEPSRGTTFTISLPTTPPVGASDSEQKGE